jgi:hypothetical protein
MWFVPEQIESVIVSVCCVRAVCASRACCECAHCQEELSYVTAAVAHVDATSNRIVALVFVAHDAVVSAEAVQRDIAVRCRHRGVSAGDVPCAVALLRDTLSSEQVRARLTVCVRVLCVMCLSIGHDHCHWQEESQCDRAHTRR